MLNSNFNAANCSNIKSSNEAINSNVNPSNEAMASKEVKSTKRAHKVEPIYRVMAKARTQFKKQVMQNNETKKLCIESNIASFYSDSARFWADYKKEFEYLLSWRRFESYCNEKGMNPEYVAQHVIFEGKGVKKQILNEEFEKALGEKIKLFNAPLFKDPENLFSNQSEDTADRK